MFIKKIKEMRKKRNHDKLYKSVKNCLKGFEKRKSECQLMIRKDVDKGMHSQLKDAINIYFSNEINTLNHIEVKFKKWLEQNEAYNAQ